MSLTRDKQGFLEDLNSMTLPQLKELLERQEKLLMKKKFVASLPDKGEKSRQFAGKLRTLIENQSKGNSNSNNFNILKNNSQESSKREIIKDTDEMTMETLVTRNETDIAYSSEAIDSNVTGSIDLTQQMQELSVGTRPPKDDQHIPTNSYERVIKKVEANPSSLKTKFIPNRSKRDMTSNASTTTTSKHTASKPQSSKVREESAVFPPSYSRDSTKLISVEESVKLIEEQGIKTEQLQAERAAQRLAEQFAPKMDTYQPSNTDMRYRQKKSDDDDEDDDQDSDDIVSDDDKDGNDDDNNGDDIEL